MKLPEFSQYFDLFYNNLVSNQAPGHTEYEKSLILTQALELEVKELYEGTAAGFERTESIAEALQPLVKQETYNYEHITSKSLGGKVFIPIKNNDPLLADGADKSKIMYVVYEEVLASKDNCDDIRLLVTPVTHNDFYSSLNNPFKGPKGNRALRLLSKEHIELFIPEKYNFTEYNVRYVAYPKPIILPGAYTELGGTPGSKIPISTYTINGYKIPEGGIECELPPFVHKDIIMKAVTLAKAAWNS